MCDVNRIVNLVLAAEIAFGIHLGLLVALALGLQYVPFAGPIAVGLCIAAALATMPLLVIARAEAGRCYSKSCQMDVDKLRESLVVLITSLSGYLIALGALVFGLPAATASKWAGSIFAGLAGWYFLQSAGYVSNYNECRRKDAEPHAPSAKATVTVIVGIAILVAVLAIIGFGIQSGAIPNPAEYF